MSAQGPSARVDREGRAHRAGLSDKSVAEIIKRYAAAAGLDPGLDPAIFVIRDQ
jgi:hypothetical protein